MHIVIFHYHLNPGGVTRIIESQVAGFKQEYSDIAITVLTGYCENVAYYNALGVDVVVNPMLNYLENQSYTLEALKPKYDDILALIKETAQEDVIFHAHNVNLGKNPLVTLAFNQLLLDGYVIFNHAHDFSEDRPKNQAFLESIITGVFEKSTQRVMYPRKGDYMVGVLNRLDYNRVLEYGIKEKNVYLLPNPVHVLINEIPNKANDKQKIQSIFNIDQHRKIITYPVRVIQRKNIGELILLAALYKNIQFLVTMAPRNPDELVMYNEWKLFCVEHNIDIIFEAGEKANFVEIISGSDYCITTSIKEGFGMAYLEPWLLGTPVIGRNISYVTSDIKDEGLVFPFLYDELILNLSGQHCDFAELNNKEQKEQIKLVLKGSLTVQSFCRMNPDFENFPPIISQQEVLENKQTISKNFSIKEYAKRIHTAYKTVY